MIYRAEDYYSISDYARLCGVSERNISDRIRAGSVSNLSLSGFRFVNAYVSPPVPRINRYKPVKRSSPRPQPFSIEGLKEVGVFCRQHRSEGIIYEGILIGKLDGYIIGDKVFIKPVEAEAYYKNHKGAPFPAPPPVKTRE